MEGPCTGCIKHQEDIMKLSKRLDRLEKAIPIIKKFRTKTGLVRILQLENELNRFPFFTNCNN